MLSKQLIPGLFLAMQATCWGASIIDRPNIVFRNMGVDQGLSNSQIHAVHQDPTGMIWIGTGEGLNSYDGVRFRTYDEQNTNLISDSIQAIQSTRNKTLWIATGDGLYSWPTNLSALQRFGLSNLDGQVQQIQDLLVDSKDNLWVAHEKGISIISPQHQKVIHPLTGIHVRSLGEDRKGQVWAGTTRGEIYRFDSTQDSKPTLLHLPNTSPIRTLVNAVQNQMWIGTFGSGLFIIDDVSLEIVDHHQMGDRTKLMSNEIRSILNTAQGKIYIGTGRGLSIFNPENRTYKTYVSSPSSRHSLAHDVVIHLYEDMTGLIWVSTYIDLSVFQGSTTYLTRIDQSNEPNLPDGNIMTFELPSDSQDIWIGTLNGLAKWDSTQGIVIDQTGLVGNKRISSLEFDDEGNLWIGTIDSGIVVLDPDDSVTLFSTSSRGNGLPGNGITSIETDYSSRVWVGVFSEGIFYFNGNNFQNIESFLGHNPEADEKLSLDLTRVVVLRSDESNLWIGTLGQGLFQIDLLARSITQIEQTIGFRIVSITPTPGACLWLGTTNDGAYLYNKRTTKLEDHYTTADGLSSNGVYGIIEVNNRNVWISSGRGLNQLDPVTRTILHYGRDKGAQHNDFNANAFGKTSDGILLFGGANGFNAFVSDKLPTPTKGPPITLRSITGEGQLQFDLRSSVTYRPLELDHATNDLDFELAVLDYTNPGNNRYKYRLNGYDTSWQTSRYNHAFYTNLDPGDYSFEFMGSTGDDVWSETSVQAPFTILNPPWLTWWAYTFYFILTAGIIWIFRMYTLSRIKLANIHYLEQLVEERTQTLALLLSEKELLLKEIHHRVKNNMQLISSLLTIQSQSIQDSSIKSMFRMCQGRIQAMALIHESLYKSHDLQAIDIKDYLKALVANLGNFQHSPNSSDPEISLSVDPIIMSIDTAIVCGLIVNELVTNSLKHAFPKAHDHPAISIALKKFESSYSLCVSDNGSGIVDATAFEKPDSIGVSIISVLALRQLEGKMVLNNISGTSVEIIFPIGR
jgi:two-component sensor histidine kinase/ligand-binding sensor domain-containing protein